MNDKNKTFKSVTGCLTRKEILENYMSFATRDNKKILNELNEKFGSLDRAFASEVNDMINIFGISTRLAVFMKLTDQFMRMYKQEKFLNTSQPLTNELICKILKNKFWGLRKEKLAVILLDKDMKLKYFDFMNRGEFSYVDVPIKDIAFKTIKCQADYIVLAHNHPSGNCLPSKQDIINTKTLKNILNSLGVGLIDHYIVSDSCVVSLSEEGII